MSNEELAVLAQQGNREAISALWEQVKRLLYQLARVDLSTRPLIIGDMGPTAVPGAGLLWQTLSKSVFWPSWTQ